MENRLNEGINCVRSFKSKSSTIKEVHKLWGLSTYKHREAVKYFFAICSTAFCWIVVKLHVEFLHNKRPLKSRRVFITISKSRFLLHIPACWCFYNLLVPFPSLLLHTTIQSRQLGIVKVRFGVCCGVWTYLSLRLTEKILIFTASTKKAIEVKSIRCRKRTCIQPHL